MVAILIVFVVGVIVVNGWTDAPAALTTAVCENALPYRTALWWGALCNGVGALLGGLLFAQVGKTVLQLSPQNHPLLLCWVMGVVIIWSSLALWLGIPTSESHALLAVLWGVSFGMGQGMPNMTLWLSVAVGLILSAIAGWGLGNLLPRLLQNRLKQWPKSRSRRHILATMSGLSMLHGAQDGQKFVAMLWAAGLGSTRISSLGAVMLCAAALMLGSSLGGRKIISKVGREMTNLDTSHGLCSDWATIATIFICTVAGLPISTGTVRVCAVAGAGRHVGQLKQGLFVRMWGVWILTFPICFGLGLLGGIIYLHI